MGGINLLWRKLRLLGDSAMWLIIVGLLSLGLGILALIGLLALVKELFCESTLDADFTDPGGAAGRDDVGRTYGSRGVMTP
jgi:hypothetical protein